MRPVIEKSLRSLGLALAAVLSIGVAVAQGGSYEDALSSARLGDTRQLAELLKRGVDPDTVDEQGNTLLILAARDGHLNTVKTVLGYRPRLGARNLSGDSALMLAVLKGYEEVVDVLLEAGAPVAHEGWTPLHYAAFEGRVALADKLLAHKAPVDALAPNLATPLMMAARNGHIDMVRRLLAAGARTDLRSDRGETAESWALSRGNTDIAALIAAAERRPAR